MPVACLGLGSNLGDRRANLDTVLRLLSRHGDLTASSFIETQPVGLPTSPAFLNGAVMLRTRLNPRDLLGVCRCIEGEVGRVHRDDRARTIDLDILLYDSLVIFEDSLVVPHPRFPGRWFVLEPLAQVAKDIVHPVLGLTVGQMLWRLLSTAVVDPHVS